MYQNLTGWFISVFMHFINNPSSWLETWPRGYKTFFMLNSTEHEISTVHKTKIPTNKSIIGCIYHANKC